MPTFGSPATCVKALAYLSYVYKRTGFIRASLFLTAFLTALESRKLREHQPFCHWYTIAVRYNNSRATAHASSLGDHESSWSTGGRKPHRSGRVKLFLLILLRFSLQKRCALPHQESDFAFFKNIPSANQVCVFHQTIASPISPRPKAESK